MPGFGEPMLHVDMDAFFVEVERKRRPELRGVPVLVGGLGNRGVVAAASYEARRHGAHSAMPMVHARRLCPHARLLPPDHAHYRAVSAQVFAVLGEVTPAVEALSIDEAFLDVAGLRLHYPHPEAVGAVLRRRLRDELDLPASVGIATTKLLAKLASEAAKPDGLLRVPAGEELDFLHPLPVRSLWGVGESTYAALEALGVRTVGDLAALPEDVAARRLGNVMGRHLWALAWGRDPRPVETAADTKSVSIEETFEQDVTDPAAIGDLLFRQCERLSRRLRAAGLSAGTVTLKVRYADFTTVTRSLTAPAAVDETADLFAAVRTLLGRLDRRDGPFRLLGVGGSKLEAGSAPRQLELGRGRRRGLVDAADAVRARFGEDAIGPARLLPGGDDSTG